MTKRRLRKMNDQDVSALQTSLAARDEQIEELVKALESMSGLVRNQRDQIDRLAKQFDMASEEARVLRRRVEALSERLQGIQGGL